MTFIRRYVSLCQMNKTKSIRKPICPIDPTCTFWPKGQCERPYEEENACWKCGREVVKELQEEIARLRAELFESKADLG